MAMAFTPEMEYPFPRYYGACGRYSSCVCFIPKADHGYNNLFIRFAVFEYVGLGLDVLSRFSPWSVR